MRIAFLLFILLSAATTAVADASISNIVVNQRWPWSEKIDVDFIVTGDSCDVDVLATWDGRDEPCLLGTMSGCGHGQHTFTWDPATSLYSGEVLTGFTVSITNHSATARQYLVLDLANGGHEYLSSVPEGGWTSEHKSTKMVFRRIPAGTYTLGEPQETFEFFGLSDPADYAAKWNRRTVTFTSDFYVAVFLYTEAQHDCLTTGTAGTSLKKKSITYDALRGDVSEADWPTTGYAVASNSVVALLRERAVDLVVDLCQEDQLEVAARAGTTTILPNGVTVADDLTTFTNKLNEIASWIGTKIKADIGSYAPNDWGLYDVCGLATEWTLDWAARSGTLPSGGLPSASTDPVGASRTSTGSGGRVLRSTSGGWKSFSEPHKILPCSRQINDSDKENTPRFCIHLKPLGSLEFP